MQNKEVPNHVLDIVVQQANWYAENQQERWLADFSPARKEWVKTNATHNIVSSAERRELHKEILKEIFANIDTTRPDEKPTLLYLKGPMAAGKTTLLETFDKRIAQQDTTTFKDQNIEELFNKYKNVKSNMVGAAFGLCKKRLPEFKQHGGEFAMIRPEAHAINMAVTQWAKDLNLSIIREELGDGNTHTLASKLSDEYRFIAVGITADPIINRQRLHERNEIKGEKISDSELDKTIRGFSDKNAFLALPEYAEKTILISSDGPEYKTILKSDNGKTIVMDAQALDKFKAYNTVSSNIFTANFDLNTSTQAPPEPA